MSDINEMVDAQQLVYVPDSTNGFALGRIVDIGAESLTVRLIENEEERRVEYNETVPAIEDQETDVDDNCNLMFLNEGTLLHNCRLRYDRKKIYTYVGNILISINPYELLPDLYSAETIREYRGRSLGLLPPHIFAIADKAYRDMRRTGASQSIVVSGESGAGKTECQKYVLRYLCENYSDSSKPIERLILETNPLLEAFGNAKTLRNNNSSRFGKFVEVHFGQCHGVVGAHVSHYLIEQSRVCIQQSGERNYHAFYQLLAGANSDQIEQFGLDKPEKFNYLRNGCTQFFGSDVGMVQDEMVDDVEDFVRLNSALENVKFERSEVTEIFKILAGILHLGNIEFVEAEGTRGGCTISNEAVGSLVKAAEMLGLEEEKLREGLTTRVMQTARGSDERSVYFVQLKPDGAIAARDGLAKAIYSRLFDEVVCATNRSIPFGLDATKFIGVLDIAGFEFFKSNSFEQFCVNYCNEKLQKFFNDRVLKQEQVLYANEGLSVPTIEYTDNHECIDLFEKKGTGLLELLDEEGRLPRPSTQHFTESVHQSNRDNPRLQSTRNFRRDLRDSEGFVVRHYAADVCYETAQFLEKNSDSLHNSLELLMENSKNTIIARIFVPKSSTLLSSKPPMKKQKLVAPSCSSKFRFQLSQLVMKLELTGTHFVRCIKPNSAMRSGQFESMQILEQLRCAGMNNVLRLMQMGFPSRYVISSNRLLITFSTPFTQLYSLYVSLLPDRLAQLDPRLFCKCLFHAFGLNDSDFQFGLTRVFFRSGKYAEFDQLMREDPQQLKEHVIKAQSWLHRIRWKKVQFAVLSCIKIQRKIEYRRQIVIKLQAMIRGYLTRRQVLPMLEAKRKQKTLEEKDRIVELASQEIADKETTSTDEISQTENQVVDVSAWSYQKLRSTINSTTDHELQRVCRVEFHRRMRGIQNWKLANAKNKRIVN
ncbi:Myosin motor domain-containing protein [Aphelenchoides besseyi]|nr:Myosin motor domain-containing protein [Aphelenchoides besseyi]